MENNKRVVDNRQHINDDEKMKINMRAELDEHYTMLKECPKCGTRMIYAYGEVYDVLNVVIKNLLNLAR